MRNDNRITKKLRSEKGASITFGLLLFLICAVISSMVIVAGTSAAGRLSGMGQTEQRYYSVTSTAKLIQEQLEKGSAAVIKIGEDVYIGSGASLDKVQDEKNIIDSLPEYIAYKINKGDTTIDFKLTPTPKDIDVVDAISVKATYNTDTKIIHFAVSSDNYSFPFEMTTNIKTIPVELGDDTAYKEEYTWEVTGLTDYPEKETE